MKLVIPPQLETLMLSRGDSGKEWLIGLPTILGDIEKNWQIRLEEPFSKCYCNYVSRATTGSGDKVVLKVSYDSLDFAREIGHLKLQSKENIPEVVKTDESLLAVLMEEVEPADNLTSVKNDDDAVKIAANLMQKCWKDIDPNNIYNKTSELYPEFTRLRADPSMKNIFSTDLVNKADTYYQNTLISPTKYYLLHGDLHQFNIINSTSKGWIMIDPSGFYGEPAYEVAAFLRNPPNISDKANPKELLTNRIMLFSRELNIDPLRILWWGLFQTVLSSWWAREDNSDFLNGFEKTAIALGEIEL